MKHNPQAAAEFLQCLGGDSFVFQTFDDSKNKNRTLSRVLIGSFVEHESALTELNNKGAGIFVQANRGAKRGKDHITGIRVLFVDLDDPSTAKESILTIQKFMPKPTAIINSSKGKYHIYWKVLDCKVEDFKKMQVQLAIKFNADLYVSNVDRVMRLPGFAHQKGEPFVTTAVLPGTVHTVDALYKAAAKAPTLTPTSNGTATKEVNRDPLKKDVFGLNIGSDYEVPDSVPAGGRNYSLIQYVGHIVGTGTRDEKEAQNLVRKQNNKFADPLPENELEATVFQSLAKYIEEAKAEDNATALVAMQPTELNTEGSVVPVAPVPTAPVANAVPTPPPEDALDVFLEKIIYVVTDSKVIDTRMKGSKAIKTLRDFKNEHTNKKIGKTKLADMWMANHNRQDVHDLAWVPIADKIIEDEGVQLWNTYIDSEIVAIEKELYDPTKAQSFFDHLDYFFPEVKDRDFFMDWLAYSVRYPQVKIMFSPLIIAGQGHGKGFIFDVLSALVGKQNSKRIQSPRIDSQFNSFLAKSTLVLLDELQLSGKRDTADKLKVIISERNGEVNRKGIEEEGKEIFCNIIIFTNHKNAAIVEKDDRRFWIHRVMGTRKSAQYYQAIFKEYSIANTDLRIAGDGLEKLRHLKRWCLERDVSKFKPAGVPPSTASKDAMRNTSMDTLEDDLQMAIEGKEGPFAADVTTMHVAKDYMMIRDLNATEREFSHFKAIWLRVSENISSVTQVRPLPGVNGHERNMRPRSIRNHVHWNKAVVKHVRTELSRSIQMAMPGDAEVFPPVLELVKGDNDAK